MVGEGEGAGVGLFVVGLLVGADDGACVGDTVGEGVSHTFVVLVGKQRPLAQSECLIREWPAVHGGQTPPPQSVSVSECTKSVCPFKHHTGVGAGDGAAVGAAVGENVGASVIRTEQSLPM